MVLFENLVGSTALSSSQDPERTRVLLDRFYDAMTEEIERALGTIEQRPQLGVVAGHQLA
jgi:class 3 adenylate cyclase